MAEQAPVMFVEIKVRCKECKHDDIIEVPVTCAINTEVKDSSLACGIVGEATEYIKKCEECGSKKFEIKSRKIRFSGTGN